MKKLTWHINILCFFCLSMMFIPWMQLSALDDDIDINTFKLPANAVLLSTVTVQEDVYSLNEHPFTGILYEKYANGTLKKVIFIKKGLRNGPTYGWYSNGKVMISAEYKNGRLDGKFEGWYAYGALMYNLVYHEGRLNTDQAFLDNDDRADIAQDSPEGEGDATQKEGE